ncbi:kinase-like domain-containing protein, partial [Mycena floridula]
TTLTRIFNELCKAVGWMHDVGLVHRDIKLESKTSYPAPPQPLIKLTDFGLSRFIDPGKPLLSTKCGSEAYAAPKLPDILWASGSGGGYDARETDAWACGVVLYSLVARRLPLGERPGPGIVGETVQRTVTPSA